MALTRTDVHRPSAVVPADYEWVSFDYYGGNADLGTLLALIEERNRLRAYMARTGGKYTSHEHGGTCGICGANAAYVSIFHHRPSNEFLIVGWECAAKLELAQDDQDATRFKTAIRDARELQAGKRKAQAILADLGLSAAWDIKGEEYEERTIRDIVERLVRYGSVSDKQIEYIRKLLARIPQRAAVQAQRAAEREAAAPVPTGRVTFTGIVLKVKTVDSDFSPFGVIKIVVKTEAGWVVYLTAPSALLDYVAKASSEGYQLQGSRVTLTATVEPSKDDPKFGFGKRPVFVAALLTQKEGM